MTLRIVGFTGLAGAGKDTAAAALIARGWVRVGLADPMKRACAEWFGWSPLLLWGDSDLRETPDSARNGLTPRHALQQLGTEFGRACWEDVWVEVLLATAADILAGEATYTPDGGLLYGAPGSAPPGVVVTDVRFRNEADAIRNAGGLVLRVERPGAGLRGAAAGHASEAGTGVVVDGVVYNRGTVEQLHDAVVRLTA